VRGIATSLACQPRYTATVSRQKVSNQSSKDVTQQLIQPLPESPGRLQDGLDLHQRTAHDQVSDPETGRQRRCQDNPLSQADELPPAVDQIAC
jgi:hypothetical protein